MSVFGNIQKKSQIQKINLNYESMVDMKFVKRQNVLVQ